MSARGLLGLAGRHVLIVEDLAPLRMLAAAAFKGLGSEVRVADSVREVQCLTARGYRPDVACVDVRLPDGCGLDLCESLGPDRCVVFSAVEACDPEMRARIDAMGASVPKSAGMTALREAAQAVYSRRCAATCEERVRSALDTEEPMDALFERFTGYLWDQHGVLAELFSAHLGPDERRHVESLAHRLAGTAYCFELPRIGQAAQQLVRAVTSAADEHNARVAWRVLDHAMLSALDN